MMLDKLTTVPSQPISGSTRADTIVYALTEEIVGKRLKPGEALDEGRLGQRFGVSRTPVREALRQLSASGLVILRAHRTPTVALVDEARISQMFEVMAELEAWCAALACRIMSPQARRRLVGHNDTMGEMMRSGDVAAYRQGNMVFHAMIYDGCGNDYLKELSLSTRERLAPYRGAQLEAPERLARSHAEHCGIVTAIMRGEHDNAATLMRQHLSRTRDTVALISLG